MPNTLIEFMWIFLIYSFLGWVLEVSYAGIEEDQFINRGFNHGPVCPIYGFGVLLVLYLLLPFKDNIFILFAASIVLTTLLEGATGILLKKLFNERWWDYSDEPLNFKGHVCPKFSLLWGMGCVIVIRIVHPVALSFIGVMNGYVGNAVVWLLLVLFLIDFFTTVQDTLNINKRLDTSDRIVVKLQNTSDALGENIYEAVSIVKNKTDTLKDLCIFNK